MLTCTADYKYERKYPITIFFFSLRNFLFYKQAEEIESGKNCLLKREAKSKSNVISNIGLPLLDAVFIHDTACYALTVIIYLPEQSIIRKIT